MAQVPPEAASLNPWSLSREEVRYELLVRGVEIDADAPTKDLASDLFAYHPRPTVAEVCESLSSDEEYQALRPKIFELETLAGELAAEKDHSEPWQRIISLYLHTCIRLRRCMFRATDSRFEEFLNLARRLEPVRRTLKQCYPRLAFPVILIPGAGDISAKMKNLKMGSGPEKLSVESSDSDSRSRGSRSSRGSPRSSKQKKKKKEAEKKTRKKKREESSSSATESESSESSGDRRSKRREGRVNSVTRWTMKFSGTEDLDNFLEEVEEAMEINDVSDKELLKGFSSLLTGTAKTWFRSKKTKIKTWLNCKCKLRAAFQPGDKDDVVLEKLHHLRQKPEETYAVYEARADELFRRLQRSLGDREKLRFLLNGLHLYYRRQVVSEDIESLRELRMTCGRLEGDKAQVQKLEREEERRRERTDPPRRGYRVAAAEVEVAEESTAVEVAAVAPPKKTQADIRCFRCGGANHFAHQCKEKISCISCRKEGVILEHCQDCQASRMRAFWGPPANAFPQQQVPGNQMGPWMWGNPGPLMGLSPWSVPPPQVVASQQNSSSMKTSSQPFQPRPRLAGPSHPDQSALNQQRKGCDGKR